ncbi:MAG: arginase [Rhizobiaceae bacterium MnEN-MB40S]|nr:MAG: arginase [Rhizobiaceae bacterium MnEN-MB40S]
MGAIRLIGAPVDHGSAQRGCLMGPDALRTAGLEAALSRLGHDVADLGNLAPDAVSAHMSGNAAIHDLETCAGWISALARASYDARRDGDTPVFLGGDHLMSAGTVAGAARHSAEEGREQFVLWLDAHTDFHTLESTESGNLHGTPVAYFTGQPGFAGSFPDLEATVNPQNICMIGIRSVDPAERAKLADASIEVCDMRQLDEEGVGAPLRNFLSRVEKANGRLHVSLDVDFLDPQIAPAVGTTVPGGATFREAHLVMEMLHDSGLVTSLDVAELNPFLDERGRTAILMADLVASLFGKRVMDRPTRSIWP